MKVKIKINSWLRRSLNLESNSPEEISISASEGESVLGIVSHLAKEDRILWKSIFDERNHIIHPNVIVVLNDRIVNPYDKSEATLKDGDELTLLPMFDGG